MTEEPAPRYSIILIALMVLNAVVGLCVPGFYEWTGSDQSRPSHLLWSVPLGFAFLAGLASVFLPWLLPSSLPEVPTAAKQFSVRTLLVLTAACAVALAVGSRFPVAVSHSVLGLTLLWIFAQMVRHPDTRLATCALLGCMWLPFLWTLGLGERENPISIAFWMLTNMAGFLPTAITANWIGEEFHDAGWLASLYATAQILLGLLLIKGGPRRTLSYLMFLAVASGFGSIVLNALFRA